MYLHKVFLGFQSPSRWHVQASTAPGVSDMSLLNARLLYMMICVVNSDFYKQKTGWLILQPFNTSYAANFEFTSSQSSTSVMRIIGHKLQLPGWL